MEGKERLDLIRNTIKQHVDEGHNFQIVKNDQGVILQLNTADGTRESTLYNGDSRAEILSYALDLQATYLGEKRHRD